MVKIDNVKMFHMRAGGGGFVITFRRPGTANSMAAALMSRSRVSHSPFAPRDCRTRAVIGGRLLGGGAQCRMTPVEVRLTDRAPGGLKVALLGIGASEETERNLSV